MHRARSASAPHAQSSGVRALVRALRPRQWTKNLVIFAAPFFGFSITLHSFGRASLAFAAFCCASSAFYLINDVVDADTDRRHPIKRDRPVASGAVSVPVAIATACILLAGAVLLGRLGTPALLGTVVAYLILQVAYNTVLKKAVILDIIAISAGFVLRALAGGAATGIVLSSWFLLCTALLALFLAIEKRKSELSLISNGHSAGRAVLGEYTLPLLGRMEAIVAPSAFMTYALWSSGPQVAGAPTPWMLLTLPFVLYGMFRYQVLSDPNNDISADDAYRGASRGERPEEVLLTDRPLLITVVGWVVTVFAIALLKHAHLIV